MNSDRPTITIAVDLGSKATKQSKAENNNSKSLMSQISEKMDFLHSLKNSINRTYNFMTPLYVIQDVKHYKIPQAMTGI